MGPCPRGGDAFFEGGGTTYNPHRIKTSSALFCQPQAYGLACDRRLDTTEPLLRLRKGADWHMPAVRLISSPPVVDPVLQIHRDGMQHSAIYCRRLLDISLTAASPCYLDKTDSELSDTPTTRVTNDRENSTAKCLAYVFNGRPAGRRTPMFQVRFQGPTF